MAKRLSHIVDEVNNYHKLLGDFDISHAAIKRMFNDVDNAINSWQGVDMNSCKKSKTSFKAYKTTYVIFTQHQYIYFICRITKNNHIYNHIYSATNWFNRNKAKIYGNYFFCPLIFKHILNVCYCLLLSIHSL